MKEYKLLRLKENFIKSEAFILRNKLIVSEPYKIDIPEDLSEFSFDIKKDLEQLTNIKIKIKDNCILF